MGFRYYRPALHVMSSFSDRVRDAIARRATRLCTYIAPTQSSGHIPAASVSFRAKPYRLVRNRIVSCETVLLTVRNENHVPAP